MTNFTMKTCLGFPEEYWWLRNQLRVENEIWKANSVDVKGHFVPFSCQDSLVANCCHLLLRQ